MSFKKIFLLNLPYKSFVLKDQHCSIESKAGYLWPPMDLVVLAGQLSSHFTIEVMDAIVEKTSDKNVINRVKDFETDYLIALTSALTFFDDMIFLRKLKEVCSSKIILCGDLPYFYPQETLKHNPEIWAILEHFPCDNLVAFLTDEIPRPGIHTEGFSDLNYEHPKTFSYGIDGLKYFALEKYHYPLFSKFPFAVTLTTTGCPFSCHYCSSRSVPYRERELTEIFKELDNIHAQKIPSIWFKDLTLTGNKARIRAICHYIIKSNYQFAWITETKSETLDEEIIELMAQAGCKTIMLGFDSDNPEILCSNSRKNDLAALPMKLSKLRVENIQVLLYLIIAWPGETKEQLSRTFKYIQKLDIDYISLNFFTPRCGSSYFEKYLGSIEKFFSEKTNISESSHLKKNYSQMSDSQLKMMQFFFYVCFYFNPKRFIRILFLNFSIEKSLLLSRQAIALFKTLIKDLVKA